MSEIINKRSEILFLYDIENANPNGDPVNEDRPRFDAETNTVLVTDVRLKRTIRDYWFDYKGFNGSDGKDIFVRETYYKEGDKQYIKDGKRRAKDFSEKEQEILNRCIDVRTFGGVIPLTNASITKIGPVQFQMGRSLNKTEVIEEQGTGAFASGEKKTKTTFRTEYKVPYALIGFNGIINEKAALHSQMTNNDKELLKEGIWDGTKSLISRSKFGQTPIFLLVIDYNVPFYIGKLRQRVNLLTDELNEIQVRSIDDYKLDITELINELKNNKDKIEGIDFQVDPKLQMLYDGKNIAKISKNEL